MAKRKGNEIKCIVKENDLEISLKNVTEIAGHDDSLPFSADIYIKAPDFGLSTETKVGRAWNDGWGGDTIIEGDNPECLAVLNKVDNFLTSTYQINVSKYNVKWDVRIDYLFAILAELSIYHNETFVYILDVDRDIEKKTPDDILPKTNQKYNYAECSVQTPTDTKNVTIALSSREKLSIKKDSAQDKKIFYYWDGGYEEFLTLLTKEPVFLSVDDFTIKSVIKLI